MSKIQEYCIVAWMWELKVKDHYGGECFLSNAEKMENYEHNIVMFEELVNLKCQEGWIPSGAADIQFNKKKGVFQAMTRKKNVKRAVVVKIKEAVEAQEVRPVRQSPRLHRVDEVVCIPVVAEELGRW